ncbi:MAG: antitoxin family protein [Polyangiales bacterium]
MSTIRARVRNGRLIVDEPTSLPEGTELELVVDDAGDSLDDAERAALDAAITRAWASVMAVMAGQGRTADDVLADLANR